MGVLDGVRRRGRSLGSAAVLAVFATTVVALALTNDGLTTTDVETNDSGVWVTRSQDNLVGRFNVSARVVDGAVTLGSASFDVLQQGSDVAVRDLGAEAMSLVDPAGLELRGTAGLSAEAQLGLGGSVVAVLDADRGALWVMPHAGLGSFSADQAEPTLEGLVGGALAVGLDGLVHVATPGGQVTTLTTDANGALVGEPEVRTLKGVGPRDVLAATAVGDEAVVLDRTTETLHLPGGRTVGVTGAGAVVLQQPGPEDDAVVMADASRLFRQPLRGGKATSVAAAAAGTPSAPVVAAGCSYGAWAESWAVVRDCPGDGDDLAQTLTAGVGPSLRYRVNRDHVVLNELATGSVWLASENFELFDDWTDVLPQESDKKDQADSVPDTTRDALLDRDKPNRPPTAESDSVGVRPGRATILRVLDNDADPDGDVLVASVPEQRTDLGTVTPVHGGAALQVDVPEKATGETTFRYRVEDGRGMDDSATVRLRVHPWTENAAPARVRAKAVPLELGGTTELRVLEEWLDPDGDDLVLTDARAGSGDSVRFRPDGAVTFRDAGTDPGKKALSITVSDGQAETKADVVIDVAPEGQQPPISRVDHVTGLVGQPITVEPLLNDVDPNGDELRIARVEEQPPAKLVTDFDAGTVTVTSDVPRVYYFTYLVTDGPSSVLGLIRVDVVEPPAEVAPPVAVRDTAMLPADGSVLVDVLANDVDPGGGVLVLQQVDVDPALGVSAEVIDRHLLRLTAIRTLEGPVTLRYTVSNGHASAVGEVLVVPVPAPSVLRPPRASDDEAVVRVGDVVTIPVLSNDSHPDNAVIALRPDLVEQPDADVGRIFTTDETIRFHAGDQARTVHAVYEVEDPQGQVDSAQVTIHVRPADAERNAAPRPRDLEARVLAGQTVRVIVPTAGTDPDGDRVTVTGLDSAPSQGRVTTGPGWFDYEAGPTAAGTDTFTYRVVDTLGAASVATVTVGVAPAAEANREPRAVDDIVYVRPGRVVAVPVLVNDVDPEGDQVRLVTDGLELPKGLEARVELDRVVVTAPDEPGTVTLYYTITDSLGARGVGALTVDVDGEAPLRRPMAVDDAVTVADVVGKDVIAVPVLDNDDDPDGFAKELTVSLPDAPAAGDAGDGPTASVTPTGEVNVTLLPSAQIVPYTVTDQDGLTATAFVFVPGVQSLPPELRPGAPALTVVSGELLTVDIAEHVVVSDGRTPRLSEAGKVAAVRGTGEAASAGTVTYRSDTGYSGPAAISFEVADGDQDDPGTQTSVLTVPITVLPVPHVNSPPTASSAALSVEVGTEATLDLSPYGKDPDDGDTLAFALAGAVGNGLTASIDGARLTVKAATDVPKGTRQTAAFTVTDSEGESASGRVEITVTGSRKPLATTNLDRVEDVHQGETVRVPVLANDASPFPEPLTLVSARLQTGSGSVKASGDQVEITPADDFVGTLTATYTVRDATNDSERDVEGRVEITVLGRPGELTVPSVVEVRSKTVVLSWDPPISNGSPITGYTVTANDGRTFACKTTTCTLDGLTNDVEYTFVVVAKNDVGESDPSPASAVARPDERPDAPAAPTLEFGDASLTVTWTNQAYTDRSAIETVTLEISPAPPSGVVQKTGVTGTSLVWDGLANGTEYRVRVQAVNRAPEPSDFSPYSLGEVPAGVPETPGAPTASRVDTPLGGEIDVRWSEPGGNGDKVASYELDVHSGGAVVRSLTGITGTSQTLTGLDVSTPYSVTVRALNKAGLSQTSAASAEVVPFGKPGPVGRPQASLPKGATDRQARLTWPDAEANGSPVTYRVRANGTVVVRETSATSATITGLTNGRAYTFTVEAMNAGGSSGESSASNEVVPYGAPPVPTVSAVGSAGNVALHWRTGGTNGRPVQIQININGRGWDNAADSGTHNVAAGYSETHSIQARAVDTEGGISTSGRAEGTSDAPPPTRVWVSAGSNTSGAGCASGCKFFVANFENWRGASRATIRCQGNRTGTWETFGGSSFSYNIPANGSVQLRCFYGNHGAGVRVLIDGTPYGESVWPDY